MYHSKRRMTDTSDSTSSSISPTSRSSSPSPSSTSASAQHKLHHSRARTGAILGTPSYKSIYHRRPLKSAHTDPLPPLRCSPEPPTLLALASSFQTLLDSQVPISSPHSAHSELLSVSSSAFPPSTLPISALTDLIHSNNSNSASTSSSSTKSSFSSVSTSVFDHTRPMAGVGTATTAGLDLLGILAEEVDWDPQQRGGLPGAAQMAVLGHHEAKQKLWAVHILDSLGLTESAGSRRGSFSNLTASFLPRVKQSEVNAKARCGEPKTRPAQSRKTPALCEDPLNTMTLTKRTALFYENLYERLCPGIVPRAYMYPKLGRKSHDQDPTFAALALSISLLGLLRLTLPATEAARGSTTDIGAELKRPFTMPAPSPDKRTRAQDSGQLRIEATRLIERVLALRLSSTGEGICFGQTPTLETVLTSFFLSLALYNLDDEAHEGGMPSFTEWKDASFFRFCEAITLAKILGIDQVGLAAVASRSSGEVPEEAKVWCLLVRAERWWADQKAGYVCQMEAAPTMSNESGKEGRKRSGSVEDSIASKKARRTEFNSAPLGFLVKLGFEGVRDDLLYRFRELIDCWTCRCASPAVCRTLTPEAAVRIHDSLASFELSSTVHRSADPILVDLARQTLRAKLWVACLDHNLIATRAPGPLRPDQPLHIALDTLDLLEDLDQLVLRSLPSGAAMGEAVTEALQQIRDCVASLPEGRFAAESFSFEHIDGSEDSDEPSEAGRAEAQDEARANSTTIMRAAQSVMDNLDRFLLRAGGM